MSQLATVELSELATTYRDQIASRHKHFSEHTVVEWLEAGKSIIKDGRGIGQLIIAAKNALKENEFKAVVEGLSEAQIKLYVRYAKHAELTNNPGLLEVVPMAMVGATAAGAVPMPQGHGPQQLHENDHWSRWIKLGETLIGDVNQQLKDRPLSKWQKDELVSLAAIARPYSELYNNIKLLLNEQPI